MLRNLTRANTEILREVLNGPINKHSTKRPESVSINRDVRKNDTIVTLLLWNLFEVYESCNFMRQNLPGLGWGYWPKWYRDAPKPHSCRHRNMYYKTARPTNSQSTLLIESEKRLSLFTDVNYTGCSPPPPPPPPDAKFLFLRTFCPSRMRTWSFSETL